MENKVLGINVHYITDDVIEILGKKYYLESYLIEMMRREYQRGLSEGFKNGQQVHICEFVDVTEREYGRG